MIIGLSAAEAGTKVPFPSDFELIMADFDLTLAGGSVVDIRVHTF